MKIANLIGILIILPTLAFSQTGYFPFELPDMSGWFERNAIIKANDGNIIFGYNDYVHEKVVFKKITSEGEEIWNVTMELPTESQYGFNIFPIPGDGYYCFFDNEYVHLEEDGAVISLIHYDLSDLGYAAGTFEGVDVNFVKAVYTGTSFHLVSKQSKSLGAGVTPLYYYTLTEINIDGSVVYSNSFDWGAGNFLIGDHQLGYSGGYDYVYQNVGVSYGAGYSDSLFIQRVATGSTISENLQTISKVIPTGVLSTADGFIGYAKVEGVDGITVDDYLIKINFEGDTLWTKKHNLFFTTADDSPQFKDLIELPSNNLLGLIKYYDHTRDTVFHRIQLYTQEGELLFTSPSIISYNNWEVGDVWDGGIEDITMLGDNLIGFTGFHRNYSTGGVFVLLTDTLGNYFHLNVTGQLYNDANGNGTFDSGEVTFPDKLISTAPLDYYAFTNEEGKYNLMLGNDGDFIITVDSIDYWDIIEPASSINFSVDTSMDGETFPGYDFLYDYTLPVHEVSVQLHQGPIVPGFETYNTLTISNLGNQYGETGTATLEFPSVLNYSDAIPAYSTISDTIITWDYSELDPFEPQIFKGIYLVDVTAPLGEFVQTKGYNTIGAFEINNLNNSDSIETEIVSSFDPNHKSVAPVGEGLNGNIDFATEYLTYTIEFQNTGSAPAQFINIYDTLSEQLEITSVEMLSASHDYTMYLDNSGILRWNFDSIFLPDSATDLIGSMGYLKFRIKIKDDVVVGDVIENTGAIYFDYNAPVITNTTVNTLIGPNGIDTDNSNMTKIHVYPNPASAFITFNLSENYINNINLVITDLSGRVCLMNVIKANTNSTTIDISNLSQGLYFCSFSDNENLNLTKLKFIVIK